MSRSDRHERTSARRLAELCEALSERDLAVLNQVAQLRFMSAKQIEAIHFAVGVDEQADGHEPQPGSVDTGAATAASRARAARRALARLADLRLLRRLERRIGGVRAGSAAHVYAIGSVGERVLDFGGPRRRSVEPSWRFLRHTLAITELVTRLTVAARSGTRPGAFSVLEFEAEPACWRRQPDGRMLRPDLFIAIESDELEYRWFVEVDLGTEHLPTLLRKCQAYEAYYCSGIEQDRHGAGERPGVFPRVLWLMHTPERVQRLRAAIGNTAGLTDGLFIVTTYEQAVDVAAGGAS